MNQLKSKWKNLSKEVKWSIGVVVSFVVVGSIIIGISFGIQPTTDLDTINSTGSESSSEIIESQVVSDSSSEVVSQGSSIASIELKTDLSNYSGYWYNSSDLESYEFNFNNRGTTYGEFTLSVYRLGTITGTCELTSSNVASFVSTSNNSGTYMEGILTFNPHSIEVIITNPDQYWPSYILLDQPNGSSPLVINAPEVDYNDPTYVPEDAYGPNGEKYAADAADIPQPTVVCPQCGTKFFDTASFIDGVCDSCYQANNQPVYCSACWNHVTDESHGGYCESCWNKVQQGLTPGPDPNVWCPDCGTGYFVTGVGNGGIYCKVCQKNFMP